MLVAHYQTKKKLKEAIGKQLLYSETSMFNLEYNSNSTFCVVGPAAYTRKWYAQITMRDGMIHKVK